MDNSSTAIISTVEAWEWVDAREMIGSLKTKCAALKLETYRHGELLTDFLSGSEHNSLHELHGEDIARPVAFLSVSNGPFQRDVHAVLKQCETITTMHLVELRMRSSVYSCPCACVCVGVRVCERTRVCPCLCARAGECAGLSVCAHMLTCVCARTCVLARVCVCVCSFRTGNQVYTGV